MHRHKRYFFKKILPEKDINCRAWRLRTNFEISKPFGAKAAALSRADWSQAPTTDHQSQAD